MKRVFQSRWYLPWDLEWGLWKQSEKDTGKSKSPREMNISISENKRDRDTRFTGDQAWGGWKGKAGWRSTLCSTLNVMLKSLKSIVKRMWSHPKVKNRRNECLCQGKYTDGIAHPGGSILIICLSSLLTGSPGKEHRITKPPPTKEFKQRPQEAPMSVHLPESSSLASILAEQCAQPRGGPWGGRTLRQNGCPKNRTAKPAQGSPPGLSRPAALRLGTPSNKVSCLSPQTTQVQASDKDPPWGHGWGRFPAAPALYFCEMTGTCAEGGRAWGENLKLPPVTQRWAGTAGGRGSGHARERTQPPEL